MADAFSGGSGREPAQPRLAAWRIVEMNLGFLGLQYSFGLQQGNMGPIYSYLGADEAALPLLQLAGPMTGLIVQPIVGALSDRTLSPLGRRTPYFLIGAIMAAVGLFFMPFSASLLMAASLLWLLDAGSNTTMEPYRAYVSDRLRPSQRPFGFLTQSAFTGLGQMLAFLSPSIFVNVFGLDRNAVDARHIPYFTRYAFLVGAAVMLVTVLWSALRVRELPLTTEEKAAIAARPKGLGAAFRDIYSAIADMPAAMRRLAVMCLFQWAGLACYWTYAVYAIGRSVYGVSDPHSDGFHDAVLTYGEMAAFYNLVAFVAAWAMVPFTKRFGPHAVHSVCLALAAAAVLAMPSIHSKALLFIPALGFGVGWASIMGNPFVILSSAAPPERTGVYMGVFNMMIVIPMLIAAAILPPFYHSLLAGDPRNVLRVAGVLLGLAALAVIWPRQVARPHPESASPLPQ